MISKNFKKVLFISHDATRTGAPIVLIHLLRWLKNNTDIKFEILLKRGGELIPEFESINPTHIMYKENIKRKLLRKLNLNDELSLIPLALIGKQYDLIYSNTITNGNLVSRLKEKAKKIITHVHEMDSWIERSGKDNWNEVVSQTTQFLAVSEPVRDCLIRRGIKKDKIELLPECVSVPATPSLTDRESIREALGISKSAFVVGGGGAEVWRKGCDVFVQLAAATIYRQRSRDFHFIWLGSHPDKESSMWLKHDSKLLGCEECIHCVGSVKNPEVYYSAMDTFVMTSREDPLPLVAIEAGMMGLPIICFNSAGGTADWVREEAGYTVSYLDIAAMAEKIILLSSDQNMLRKKGSNARIITQSRFTIDIVGKKFAEYLYQA